MFELQRASRDSRKLSRSVCALAVSVGQASLDEANGTLHSLLTLLMDDLVEDYEVNRPLIEVLARSIERWENESEEFVAFNTRVAKLGGVDVLRLLMEQHGVR